MEAKNLLFMLSDQHRRDAAGSYGHPAVQTPHIDALAARGTRFTHAHTNCPICVPARASLATGRYVHQIGYWDNGIAYDGRVPSWGHRLREQGFQVDSIGKLHFRSVDYDHGFSEEIDPLHVVGGVGDVLGCIRDNPPLRNARPGVEEAGPGESTYLQYDVRNADQGCSWLERHRDDERPWALFLSFVCPHPPYICPPEYFDLYAVDDIPLPPLWRREQWNEHAHLDYVRRFLNFTEPFDEVTIRKMNAAYYGACTFLDRQIGRVLEALRENGLEEDTRIIYTSDHGENLGTRGMFGKITLYEESSAIPLILAGPDVPQGAAVNTPVSLVDCFPTVVEAVGAELGAEDGDLPGESLWGMARQEDRERTVFGEYHAVASRHASYMLCDRRYKYVYHVGEKCQLFDLREDPLEQNDLADDPACRATIEAFEKELRALLDPDAVDARARADQRQRVQEAGGEEAVRRRGAFQNSPVPGEKPAFRQFD